MAEVCTPAWVRCAYFSHLRCLQRRYISRPRNHSSAAMAIQTPVSPRPKYVPNSQLIMQRRPKLVKAWRVLSQAVFDPDGEVSIAFKRLLAYVVARTHGCHY